MRALRLEPAIFAGGVVGTLARAGLVRALPVGHGWPWATFAVNLAGTALLGFVTSHPLHTPRRLAFAGTGVCGALTTFSAFQLEVVRLAHRGCTGLAAGYLAASLVGGVAALFAGIAAARRLERG